jgi:hypothetical protein
MSAESLIAPKGIHLVYRGAMRIHSMVVLCLLSACATSPNDEYGSCVNCGDGKADGTDPMGGAGKLVITTPPGAALARLYAHRKDGQTQSIEFQNGVPQVVSSGAYCISTQLVSGAWTQEDCTAMVPAATTTTYALGTVTFVHGINERVWGIDNANGVSIFQQGAIPHGAGTFTYGVGATPSLPQRTLQLSVTLGQNTNVDVTNIANPVGIRLLPSTNRTLPDVPGTVGGYTMEIRYSSSYDIVGYTVLDVPLLIVPAPGAQSVKVANASYPVPGLGVTDVQLKRLDLNDVQVTLADGSMTMVHGTVNITATQGSQNASVAAFVPTGYGLDLPAGTYIVTTAYVNPVTTEHLVDTETITLQ